MDSKVCTKCGEDKPLTEFPKDASRGDGRFPWCRICHSRYQGDRYHNNPVTRRKHNEYSLKKYYSDKAQWGVYQKRSAVRLREALLDAYGHACECCGVKESPFLAIDHVAGYMGGRNRPWDEKGRGLIQRLKREGYPKEDIRLLCHSCHCAISWYGYCPHQGRPSVALSYVVSLRRQHKRSVLDRLGGCCACCGEDTWEFLSIDHIHNDGAEERKTRRPSQMQWYRYLLSDQCDISRYRLLCGSCHLARSFYGACPHDARDDAGGTSAMGDTARSTS